jgi:NADH:ubiquinone oxidoreductase subunit 4 (subunit M)
MYLSGFLVKTALYGFYKITSVLGGELNSIFFSTICIVGIVDSSLKMWGQTDLKKLVAYGTVQEMNIIYLTLCWGDSLNVISGILFCITHALLSVLMFYLVDVIYRRYNSRSVVEVSGILQRTPNLAIAIFVMCVFFSGLPGTLKFTTEFYIFSSFFDISPFSCLFTFFIANCLGLIGFSKCWFNAIFGMSYKNSNQLILDITVKEFYIIFISLFLLFITCFLPNILF